MEILKYSNGTLSKGIIKKKVSKKDLSKDILRVNITEGKYIDITEIIDDVEEGVVLFTPNINLMYYKVSAKRIRQSPTEYYDDTGSGFWNKDYYSYYIPDLLFQVDSYNKIRVLFSDNTFCPISNLFIVSNSNTKSSIINKHFNKSAELCVGRAFSLINLTSVQKDPVLAINTVLSAEPNDDIANQYTMVSDHGLEYLDFSYRFLSFIAEKFSKEEVMEIYRKVAKDVVGSQYNLIKGLVLIVEPLRKWTPDEKSLLDFAVTESEAIIERNNEYDEDEDW